MTPVLNLPDYYEVPYMSALRDSLHLLCLLFSYFTVRLKYLPILKVRVVGLK